MIRAVQTTAPSAVSAPQPSADAGGLAARIDAALPQTQCTRCGYPDCHAYAEAIASGEAAINRCPPGGAEGVVRLAALTGQPAGPLDPSCGTESPLALAVIDEAWCIGCTLCLDACPVDCIVGAHKRMHTVIGDRCTGCELCLPACPVDCIQMLSVHPDRTGWNAWSAGQADAARQRYAAHQARLARRPDEQAVRLAAKAEAKLADLQAHTRLTDPADIDRKRAVIEAAVAKAQAQALARSRSRSRA